MSNGEDKEKFEITILGKQFTATMLVVYGGIASTIIGFLWSAMLVWQKIDNFVAPDMAEYDKRLAMVEETSTKTNDYTRDIKNDLKADIRKLEKVVDQVERDTKGSRRELEHEMKVFKRETDERIKKELSNPLAGN
jgi:uncharacterized protein YlxW (UPF0749 family)